MLDSLDIHYYQKVMLCSGFVVGSIVDTGRFFERDARIYPCNPLEFTR